jgi:hypothetical protein
MPLACEAASPLGAWSPLLTCGIRSRCRAPLCSACGRRFGQACLEYLAALQIKQAEIGPNGDYGGAIRRFIDSEILRAAQKFKNELQTIMEEEFGALAIGVFGGKGILTLFGGISWPTLILGAASYVGAVEIKAYLAERRAKRDCAISYVLSLDK